MTTADPVEVVAGPAPASKRRAWWALRQLATNGSLAIIKRLLRDTGRAFAWRYALVLLLGAVTAGTAALNAWLIKDVINEVFLNHRIDLLYLITAVILGNGFARAGSMYYSQLILGRIGNAIVARTQRQLFDHLLTLGADYYGKTASSELVTRLS